MGVARQMACRLTVVLERKKLVWLPERYIGREEVALRARGQQTTDTACSSVNLLARLQVPVVRDPSLFWNARLGNQARYKLYNAIASP